MNTRKFRFEDLVIWKEAVQMSLFFFELADELEAKKLWRFADQCRGVGMGIPNNIAESSGTDMVGEQKQLLRYSKRECYEGANILILLYMSNLITRLQKDTGFERLDILSRKIQAYANSLR